MVDSLTRCSNCDAPVVLGVVAFIHSSGCSRGCHSESWKPKFVMACDCTTRRANVDSAADAELGGSKMPDCWK